MTYAPGQNGAVVSPGPQGSRIFQGPVDPPGLPGPVGSTSDAGLQDFTGVHCQMLVLRKSLL